MKTWIFLESLPAVEAFCERPLTFKKTTKGNRVADFWVKWNNKEEIWLLKRESEEKQLQQDNRLYPHFHKWAQANGMEARLIAFDLAALGEVEMRLVDCSIMKNSELTKTDVEYVCSKS